MIVRRRSLSFLLSSGIRCRSYNCSCGSTIARIDSNERLSMEELKMKQGRGVIERFHEFLPPCKTVISLGEGNTPLVFSPKLSARVGRGCEVFIKNEGLNPTGSFKDRGMSVAVSRAIDRRARALICASTGNTSASAAAYAARAGIACAVVLPA